jgi:SAM-dependent methyltransferase
MDKLRRGRRPRVCSPGLLRLAAVGLGLSVLWPRLRGAPWLPMPKRAVYKLLDMAKVGPDDVVYDLGCGDGRVIIAAARRYGARAVGIEIHPLRVLWCKALVAALRLRDRVTIVRGDLFREDLSGASLVICYLLQRTNDRLEAKLRQELPAGARVASMRFTFSGLHLVREDKRDKLYLYDLTP